MESATMDVIHRLQWEIEDLNDRKRLYENMNVKLNEAISQIKLAEKSANKSCELLKKYYQSGPTSMTTQKAKELEIEHTNISNQIKTLNTIITESNTKIRIIENEISNKEMQIEMLREKLESMREASEG